MFCSHLGNISIARPGHGYCMDILHVFCCKIVFKFFPAILLIIDYRFFYPQRPLDLFVYHFTLFDVSSSELKVQNRQNVAVS